MRPGRRGERGTRAALLVSLAALTIGAGEPPVSLPDLNGKPVELSAPKDGALVLVFLWSECPISNQYAPALIELADSIRDRKAKFIAVYVDPERSDSELRAHADEYRMTFPLVHDASGRLWRHHRVDKVPMALVLNDRGFVQYRGRIDDRFVTLGQKLQRKPSPDLAMALTAVLDGTPVEQSVRPVVGCTTPGWREDVEIPHAGTTLKP